MKRLNRTFQRSGKAIPNLFAHWRNFLAKDSFTDLKIWCKNDLVSGLSLHKAVLASTSDFMASLLCDGRDETVLILPDVDKEDLLNLVKILYGESVTENEPSKDLLHLLGIKELPKISSRILQATKTTCKFLFYALKSF